ncbi:zinc finger CCCH domain-containing protein 34 isoform X1 [Salvia miltiorrhiza]|uniref:zinc finger CCCH domain-containing protein 34 isoform X1 n=1 Tax=Salvia miltiorrhiza TaxID=226208 RepID=UPI0025ABE30F|nr:zinc finger CCCH domain-containing protein 34 isoform X1 [Salvia miltiorrhiza]
MERYSGIQAMEADPVAEWAAPGGETGLEEPMWQLGLGGGPEAYPERPDEPDCIYYLRTGFCGYGNRCRFNHPRDRGTVKYVDFASCGGYDHLAMGALRAGGGEYPERVGQPICQYYIRTGMCKFGGSCKYHHPKQGVGSSAPVALNFYGYPLRLGEKECSYYVKTGQCKFGVTCKFHHPQPAGIPMPPPGPGSLSASAAVPTPAMYPTGPSPSVQSSQQYGVIQGNWPVARPAMLQGSYVPGSYGHVILPPGVVPVPGWTPYAAPVSHAASPSNQPTIGATPIYGIPQLSPSATAYTGPYLSITSSAGLSSGSQKEQAFPERPGQPECQYYIRTGDCKFGATCKYHHPPEWNASKTNYVLSPMGLPLRPGAPLCSHYAQNGVCKFGPSCKFDHPMRSLSYSPSASSLTDMPVAPYPVGSTIATLAPSSSSSDLRPELLSGFSQMSSMSSSSASVGSIFSKTGALPLSYVQQSGQGSVSSSGGSSTASHGGETHTSS